MVKPLSPYRRNAQQCPYDSFVDYESGKELKGMQYWKPFIDVLWQYINHPEVNFDGDIGVLSRKHVTVNSVTHIGKESNNLGEAEVLGVQEGDYIAYANRAERLLSNKEKILLAEPKDVKKFGVPQRTLHSIPSALKKESPVTLKDKTVKRLLAYIYSTL